MFNKIKTVTEFAEKKQEESTKFYSETTRADSSLYEPYNLQPYNPSEIYQKHGNYDLYDEMRQDEQINALLTLKKFFIIGGTWDIECEDEKVKEFLKLNLNYYLDEMFEKKLLNILTSIDYGFSLSEKIFGIEDVEGFGKKIIIKSIKTRPPHTFEFDQDNKGNIKQIRQDVAKGEDIKIKPNKMIHSAYQKEFDNPYGKSELNLGVYRAWWSKNAIIKFWNIYLERFGMPTVVGKYSRDLTKEKENIQKVLRNIQSKTSIVVPEGVEVDFLQVATKGESEYEKAIDKYNTMIARSMLVPDLMGMSGGETGGGSYSLGQEHFQMFYSNIEHETKNLERLVSKEILYPLVNWNFGKGIQAKFKINRSDKGQAKENVKLWLEAVKIGKLPVTHEQIAWFLNNVDAPEMDKGEFDKIQEEKKEVAEKIQAPDPKEDPKEDPEKNPEKDSKQNSVKEAKKEAEEEEKKEEFSMFFRSFTQYEEKIDFAKISRETESIEEQYKHELGVAYRLSINALLDEVKRRRIIENKRFDLINKLDLKNRKKILKIWDKCYKDSYDLGIDTIEKGVSKFGIVDVADEMNNKDVANWLKQNPIYTETAEAEEILKKVKGTLINSIESGSGVRETMSMLDDVLKGWDLTVDANRIETITRTVVSKAFNESRKLQYQVTNGIVAYQFSAIMDGRTSVICRSLDKKIFKPADLSYYNPPLHFMCRSLIVPIFDDEEFKFNEMPNTEMVAGGFLELS